MKNTYPHMNVIEANPLSHKKKTLQFDWSNLYFTDML